MTPSVVAPTVPRTAGWRFPSFEAMALDNGLRVLAYHCPGQFVVSASLVFDVPLSVEPVDREGVAWLTGRCLTQGAAGRTAEEFADELALCGADLGAVAFPEGFAVRLTAPVSGLQRGVELVADALRAPAFSDEEFALAKRMRLQEIEQARGYPSHVAVELLDSTLFGADRAGRPVGGTVETVESISRDDVVEFASTYLQPRGATVVVAGDFGDVGPAAVVGRCFGDWDRRGVAAVGASMPTVCREPSVVLVDWPGAPQSTLRIGGAGIPRSHDQWPALFVANYVIGGNFSSRLNTVLREQKGMTYGVGSTLDTGRGSGVFGVSTSVRADATAEALDDIMTVLRAGRNGFGDEEVDAAVRAVTDSAPLGFERAEAVTGRVEMLLTQGLPLDHVDTNLQRIAAVTTEMADAAWSQLIGPDALTVVVVGDADVVGQPLSDWSYAPVRIHPR